MDFSCCGVRKERDDSSKVVKPELEIEKKDEPPQVPEKDPKVEALERDLETEVAKSKVERKASLSGVQRSLSNLSDKLDKAESTFTPWQEIANAKQQLGDVQRTVDQEIGTTEQQLSSQPNYEGSPKVDALAKELAESKEQRRRSLSEVQENLTQLADKLGKAEGSWVPWDEIKEAKQQLGGATKVAELGASEVEQKLPGA